MCRVRNDTQFAVNRGPGFQKIVLDLILDLEILLCVPKELFPFRGQGDAFPFALEQQEIVILFQLANLLGNRRLRQEKRLRCAGKTTMFGHIVKGFELAVSQGGSLKSPIENMGPEGTEKMLRDGLVNVGALFGK